MFRGQFVYFQGKNKLKQLVDHCSKYHGATAQYSRIVEQLLSRKDLLDSIVATANLEDKTFANLNV